MPLLLGLLALALAVALFQWLFSTPILGTGTTLLLVLIPVYWLLLKKLSFEGIRRNVWLKVPLIIYASVSVSVFALGVSEKRIASRAAAKAKADEIAANEAKRIAEANAPTCKNHWKHCADDDDLVNNYKNMYVAKADCKSAAQRGATFGTPEWSWYPFGSYLSGSNGPKTGRVTLVDADVKFENGFGAKQRVQVQCVYDFNKESVQSIELR